MERNREARRTNLPAMNGLTRRKHRNVLRDSPEEDVALEMQETVRSRDRKKDRERERERLGWSKRRRNDRLIHGTNRENESTEESVNDDEDEDGNVVNDVARLLQSNHLPVRSHHQNQNPNNQLQSRKSFPPASASKMFVPVQPWKTGDEMIGVSVPRRARSASAKRLHECWVSGAGNGSGVIGEQILRQPSSSPARPSLVSAASPSTISPSSSNISARNRLKSNGSKHRPPIKASSKSSSPNQDEIEIAEVLYGMTKQPQGLPKQDITAPNDSVKFDSREVNKTSSTSDAKLIVSSPGRAPPVAIAPRRKRPRPVNYNDEIPSVVAAKNTSVPSISKPNLDQTEKTAIASSTLSQAVAEFHPESMKLEKKSFLSDSKKYNEGLVNQEAVEVKEDEAQSTKDSPRTRCDEKRQNSTSTKEEKKEEMFQIDLMSLPPQNGSSSPEKDDDALFDTVVSKPINSNIIEPERKCEILEVEMPEILNKNYSQIAESELKKARVTIEKDESQRLIMNKERFDYAKSVRDGATGSFNGNKLLQPIQMQPKPKTERDEPAITEKTAHQSSGSLPLTTSMANWPGGLPPNGHMAPQGVISMDGRSVSSTPLQFQKFIFSHPRPKKCATHNYIAKNIHVHQQFIKTNSFLQATAGAGPASLYGLKACNLNAMPSSEVHGKFQDRGVNSAQDKAQGLTTFPGHVGKDKGSQAANGVDPAQRNQQIFLQPPLPAGVPNNILHGPAFIFPMSQPQVTAASATLSVQPGSSKNPPTAGSVTSVSNSALASGAATGVAAETAATAMSFNYPNMGTNDTQYLAVLQNGSYPFPIPAHVGGAPIYGGTHAEAIPFVNGSFYSQMVHPSQLQQQPQQPPPPQTQQKLLQNLQHRPQSSGTDGGIGSLKSSPAAKYEIIQQLNQQCLHQLESEKGGEDSPSTADSRVSRTNMSVYGQNFTLMTHPVSMGTASNQSERKQQQPPQHQGAGFKGGGGESLPSQAFAMPFSSINSGGAANSSSDVDVSLMAQNQAILQNFPEGARHGYQHIMVATHPSKVTQQKKSSHHRSSEEVKNGGNDSFNMEEERKSNIGKIQHTAGGQSIPLSRPELIDTSNSTIPVSTGAVSARVSGSSNATSSQQQQQRQHQQQQIIQLQKQHSQYATATTRSKMPVGNGNVYSDNLLSSMAAIKFSNSTPPLPQHLVQNSSGSSQSPQWKNSVRPTTSQVPSLDMAAAGSSILSLKTAPQLQQNRIQQAHTQISFTGNAKSSTQLPNTSQGTAPPMMVVSSVPIPLSKGASGSSGIATSSSTNKSSQGSTLSPQYSKGGSPAVPRKSPVRGRTVPPPSSLGIKPQLPPQPAAQLSQKQQPNQLPKQAMQQTHLFLSNPYMQNQAPNSSSVASTASGNAVYYAQTQRKWPEQQQQPIHDSSATSTTGMLSLGSSTPVSLTSTNAASSDPVKAVAASSTASSVTSINGGGLPSTNPHQHMPPGFSYVPTTVKLKVTEQKQPTSE